MQELGKISITVPHNVFKCHVASKIEIVKFVSIVDWVNFEPRIVASTELQFQILLKLQLLALPANNRNKVTKT